MIEFQVSQDQPDTADDILNLRRILGGGEKGKNSSIIRRTLQEEYKVYKFSEQDIEKIVADIAFHLHMVKKPEDNNPDHWIMSEGRYRPSGKTTKPVLGRE